MTDFYKLAAARLDEGRYHKLTEMADRDLRSISDQIRWLIDREWDRRQHPTTMVDSKETYNVH